MLPQSPHMPRARAHGMAGFRRHHLCVGCSRGLNTHSVIAPAGAEDERLTSDIKYLPLCCDGIPRPELAALCSCTENRPRKT